MSVLQTCLLNVSRFFCIFALSIAHTHTHTKRKKGDFFTAKLRPVSFSCNSCFLCGLVCSPLPPSSSS